MRIYLDPGHGQATGATARTAMGNLLVEDSLNFEVAKSLEVLLEQGGHDVMLSRNEEGNPSKRQRARDAVKFRADAVLCIHHNAGKTLAASIGHAKTEIYIREHNFFVQDDGHPGLDTIFNRVRVYNTTPSADDDKEWMCKARNVMMHYYPQGFKDVALLECGYLPAPEHQKIINRPGYPLSMALRVRDWIELNIKKRSSNV